MTSVSTRTPAAAAAARLAASPSQNDPDAAATEAQKKGADHVERAMRQVDQPHDAEDQGEAGRHQEQHYAELEPVEDLLNDQRRRHCMHWLVSVAPEWSDGPGQRSSPPRPRCAGGQMPGQAAAGRVAGHGADGPRAGDDAGPETCLRCSPRGYMPHASIYALAWSSSTTPAISFVSTSPSRTTWRT